MINTQAMKIKEFFKKDINRPIETVIKADDRDHISDEVAEYVITNEIAKKIRDFFQAYNDYQGANGVWISGFFGSGKSHLLKILSYVLENKEFDGYKSGELFAEKIEDDVMLKGDVERATRIASESILFNIDQQAQITSKTDESAILSVFYKVFYDHLGYYGFQPHIAEFEMWLDKHGKYQKFKDRFHEVNNKIWEEARLDYFDLDVADILAEIFNKEASHYENILDDIEDKQKQSIADFSERVNNYIKSKPNGFRLNFFVDEVGQYISDNTKLMLNLQTIAESLATKTKGASWILVTSQEDMEKVVGDMNKQQQNDFSRIQARFKLKIPLTSANVDEVIEKRLLKKNDEAQKHLLAAYQKEKAHLSTLLSFSDVGVQFKGFRDETDYANKFPLIPYQFDLFQQCRKALSTHNAFQGKHASVGERSMLGVFQQVIQSIENRDIDALVSFDLMYEGIRNELRTEIQNTVLLAEKNLDNPFAIKVLKALFMVKYFVNFKPTKRNISVLMIDDMHVDLKQHEEAIDIALNTLENQSYVQRNGEVYEFLTDDEKDIEKEIKNTGIDDQAVTQLLKEVFFDEIIRDNRIKFLDNKQDYDFTSIIDSAVMGREKELGIEIVTENFYEHDNRSALQSQTMGTPVMKMVLPTNAIFMKDLKMYLKTNKYIKQNQTTSNRIEVKRILIEKQQQNVGRKKELIFMAKQLLADATVYLNGDIHEMNKTTDAKTKVVNAFQALVKTVYPNLKMLGSQTYSEETIKNVIRSPQDDLFGADDQTMSEAESEILNFIKRRKKMSDRTSLADLKTHFSKKPYGWYPNAIWTLTARLYKRGKIEMNQNANLLEDEAVLDALLNSAHYNNTILEIQASIDPMLVKELKSVYADAFNENCPHHEGKDVANAFKEKLQTMQIAVDQLLSRKQEYPFLKSLSTFSDQLHSLSKKDYHYLLSHVKDFEDNLLDTKEDLLDPIQRFMNGEQVKIFDDIKKFIAGNTANVNYIEGDDFKTLQALIDADKPYVNNLIKQAKAAKDNLTQKVLEAIESNKEAFAQKAGKMIDGFQQRNEFIKLTLDQQEQVLKPFEVLKDRVSRERFIGNIRDLTRDMQDNLYPGQLNLMMTLSAPVKTDGKPPKPIAKYIKKTNIHVNFDKDDLTTDEDVLAYMEALKEAYLHHIHQNTRITL